MRKLITGILLFIIFSSHSQNSRVIDSLLTQLKTAKTDTNKVNTLILLSRQYENIGSFEKAWKNGSEALELARQLNFQKGTASAYHIIGVIYLDQSNYPDALKNFLNALKAFEKILEEAKTEENKGLIAVSEKGICSAYINIANVYKDQANYTEASKYYLLGLKIALETKNKYLTSILYNNIGANYYYQAKYSEALDYYLKGLQIKKEIGDKEGIAASYINIGSIYDENRQDYRMALKYYILALKIDEEFGDPTNIANSVLNIGNVYCRMGQYALAKKYLERALKIGFEIKHKEFIRASYSRLSELERGLGNYKETYQYYKLAEAYKDSILNEESANQTLRTQLTYDFEKKQHEIKLEHEKEIAEEQLNKKKQQFILLIVAIIALAIAIVAIVVFRTLRLTRKQKQVIEDQKAIVDESQKEIIDSITYAKRLQDAILPSVDSIKKHLPDCFVLYKPKAIVAGDFYWLEHKKDLVWIAAADCTGHGVPGALVSVVCSNALNRSVKEFGVTEPGKILDKTRELVLETFEKSGTDVNDGMDISLCCINTKTLELKWAGANNPVWIVNNKNLKEIDGDKMPIGKHALEKPFTTHSLQLSKNDLLYLFTDGFADQFGGPKGKKFKYKQLSQFVLANSEYAPEIQKQKLNDMFESWKGNLEQIDDVCILGIKL